jgi:hypothetical protein
MSNSIWRDAWSSHCYEVATASYAYFLIMFPDLEKARPASIEFSTGLLSPEQWNSLTLCSIDMVSMQTRNLPHRQQRANDIARSRCAILESRDDTLPSRARCEVEALRITAREGHQELFQFLVKRGVDINKKFNHMSPIHIACQAGREDMVRCMVVRGANPNATNKEGQTALILAAELGHVAVVQTLLDLKVSVNIRDGRWQVKVSTRHGSRERPPGDHGVA